MRAEEFFDGSWLGSGEVTGPFGRVLRRFTSEFIGQWSEKARAFHTEEVIRYDNGAELRRPWVVHTEEDGLLIGYDAYQVGRMRVHNTTTGFTVRYDRPSVGSGPNVSRATLRFQETSGGEVLARGEGRILALPLIRLEVRFARL